MSMGGADPPEEFHAPPREAEMVVRLTSERVTQPRGTSGVSASHLPLQLSEGGSPAPVELSSRVSSWLSRKLREERSLLEHRHEALCEALLSELMGTAGRCGSLAAAREDLLSELLCREGAPMQNAEKACNPQSVVLGLPEAEAAFEGAPRDEGADSQRRPSPRESEASDTLAHMYGVDSDGVRTSKQFTDRKHIGGKNNITSMRSFIMPKDHGDSHHAMFERFVQGGAFEATFAVLIVLNAVVMGFEAQHKGLLMEDLAFGPEFADGVKGDDLTSSTDIRRFFRGSEVTFGVAFTLELLMKLIARKRKFFYSAWNFFDSIIVVSWLLSESAGNLSFGPNPMVLRVCRLVRLLRLLRLMKMTTMFDTLVLMVSSIEASASVLLWGVVVLFLAMTICAFVLSSSLESYVLDRGNPDNIRLEVYGYFGTYTRSMVTMFEITLASWVGVCRLLADHVGEWWAVFFITYKCVVGFAVLKVITGVFLHETFRCASLDDDLMIQQRRRARDKFKAKMMKFFDEADMEHHEEVNVDEFVNIINDNNINTWLEAMDLRVRDVGAERVFAFLAGPDMKLSREELCSGMSRLRGPTQGLDVVTLLELSAPDLLLPVSKDISRLRDNGRVSRQPTPEPKVAPEPDSLPELSGELRAAALDLRRLAGELAKAIAWCRQLPAVGTV